MSQLGSGYYSHVPEILSTPVGFTPNRTAHLMSCTNKIISVLPTGSQIGKPNSLLTFQLANQGWIKHGSVALQFTFKGTQSANSFKFAMNSASSVIHRLSVNVGSQLIDQINNYNVFYGNMLSHASNDSYRNSDASLTDGYNVEMKGSGAESYDYCIPLISGIFYNAHGRHFPSWMCGAPLQITIDTASLGMSINANTTEVTDWELTDIQLTYEQLTTDDAFNQQIRAELMNPQDPKLWRFPYSGVLGVQTTTNGAQSITFTNGVQLNSLDGVLVTGTQDDITITATNKYFNLNSNQLITDINFIVDGVKHVQYPLKNGVKQFVELQRTLGNIFDIDQTSDLYDLVTPANSGLTKYVSERWMTGCSLRRVKDNGPCFEGIPAVNVLTQLLPTAGGAGTNTVWIFYLYTAELQIDGLGVVKTAK